jgi:hypothetical protein
LPFCKPYPHTAMLHALPSVLPCCKPYPQYCHAVSLNMYTAML